MYLRLIFFIRVPLFIHFVNKVAIGREHLYPVAVDSVSVFRNSVVLIVQSWYIGPRIFLLPSKFDIALAILAIPRLPSRQQRLIGVCPGSIVVLFYTGNLAIAWFSIHASVNSPVNTPVRAVVLRIEGAPLVNPGVPCRLYQEGGVEGVLGDGPI